MEVAARKRLPHGERAFTLIELLITMAIAAILTVGVVPGFRDLLLNSRMVGAVNQLIAHLALTRSQAVKQGQHAILCPSKDQIHCLGSHEWHLGWILFVDRNRNGRTDPDEPLIRSHQGVTGITIRSGRNRTRITFRSDGFSYGTNTTFVFCDERGSDYARAVILSNPGRPRVSDKAPDGQALSCV